MTSFMPRSWLSVLFDNVRSQGGPKVSSQVYNDAFAQYRFAQNGALSGTEVALGIRNIFNASPPFDASTAGSYYSYFGDPRLASYSLSVRHNF